MECYCVSFSNCDIVMLRCSNSCYGECIFIHDVDCSYFIFSFHVYISFMFVMYSFRLFFGMHTFFLLIVQSASSSLNTTNSSPLPNTVYPFPVQYFDSVVISVGCRRRRARARPRPGPRAGRRGDR